ncbi:cell division protein FtsL [Halalkalibacillus sediminis]|uniref:Cell division protein FtsL n=1 Tax=Halalkalibacillus sediminis TaxID=2018042 RepID=A0A2I0QW15_9BACI|nr:cell division protein FtsL [Halalkalibacillus sediminis]PKR78532.1 cell division protein FtsL [Halalkalibacillus sediminis]
MAIEQVRRQQVAPQRRVERDVQKERQTVKKPWISKGEKVLYTTGILTLAIIAIMMVTFSSSIDSLNRDMQKVEGDIQHYQAQNTSLEAEVKELSNPNRILTIAEENGLNIRNADVKQANNTP